MNHRKVYSQGSIPFSWEDSPGVAKFINSESPIDIGLHSRDISLPPSLTPLNFPPSPDTTTKVFAHDHIKIPLPPCPNLQAPRRSMSAKGLKGWQEDPFLAAYKECTKSERISGKLGSIESKKISASGSKLRKGKFIFSCKSSCDVENGNLIRLSNLPPINRDRSRG